MKSPTHQLRSPTAAARQHIPPLMSPTQEQIILSGDQAKYRLSDNDSDEEAEYDEAEVINNEDIHRQGWFLEFENKETEARFVEYRYGPAGLYFPCAVCVVNAFLAISVTQMYFQADVLSDNISTWFVTKASWEPSEKQPVRTHYYLAALFTILVPITALTLNFIFKPKPSVPGRYLEIIYVLAEFLQENLHSTMDYRYAEFCTANKHNMLLRDDQEKPPTCQDFVEPYVVLTMLSAFVLTTRLKFLILVYIWLPVPFFLRKTHFGFDFIFRTSDAIWFFNCLILLIAFIANEIILRRQFVQHELVNLEVEETKRGQSAVNRLLDAMLPASVLKRLIKHEKISDYGMVSVLFSDIAGFTKWCSAQKAAAVVQMLNTMYTHFDGGLKRFGIEKVKTIGDAYWAVCGLPDANTDHVLHVCAFTKFMLRSVTRMGEDNPKHIVHIRIGVTSGYVCGGLIGSHQSAYDMFGSTNEVAELMEQRAPVDGILISEPSYRFLKEDHQMLTPDPNTGYCGCEVEVQDEALETPQGVMKTYVLKTFEWLPDLEVDQAASPASAGSPVSPGENDDKFPQENSGTPTTPQNGENGDEDGSLIETVAYQPEAKAEVEDVNKIREELSRASHCLHHTFDDEDVEAEFQTFMLTTFPYKLRAVSTMLGALVFLIYIVMLAEGKSHPWYTHIMFVVNLFIIGAQGLCAGRIKIHPLIGLCAFYLECNILLLSLLFANRSVASMDLFYLTLNFTVMSPTLGYVGARLPYLYLCLTNILFLYVPLLIIQFAVRTIYLHHFNSPSIFLAVWVIALRRSEIGQRQQFINHKLAEVALEQTKAQHKRVSELLSRMVPNFIVDQLTVWFVGPRDTMIASNFKLIGILFARVPALHHQFSDSSIDPITVMGLIGNYANVCDSVLDNFPDLTKLKIIGDILLFASGLDAHRYKAPQALTTASRTETASQGTTAESHRSSEQLSQTSSLGDFDVPQHRHHIVSLAHLALALSARVEEEFNGAVLSAGMHCGTATAGIIGNDRLIYDVFGDTVNTSSRVMSTSGEGVWASVKFSTTVASKKRHGLFFGEKEERKMKGKGVMHVVSVASLPDA